MARVRSRFVYVACSLAGAFAILTATNVTRADGYVAYSAIVEARIGLTSFQSDIATSNFTLPTDLDNRTVSARQLGYRRPRVWGGELAMAGYFGGHWGGELVLSPGAAGARDGTPDPSIGVSGANAGVFRFGLMPAYRIALSRRFVLQLQTLVSFDFIRIGTPTTVVLTCRAKGGRTYPCTESVDSSDFGLQPRFALEGMVWREHALTVMVGGNVGLDLLGTPGFAFGLYVKLVGRLTPPKPAEPRSSAGVIR